MTYLAAYSLYQLIYQGKKLNKILLYVSSVLIVLLGIAFTALPLIEKFKKEIIDSKLIKDDFAMASLQTPVQWRGFEFLAGILFLVLALFFFIRLFKKTNARAFYALAITSILTTWLLTVLITPRIEEYSQGPAIEFYENLKDKDCYVETIGFKSYAYMFYTNRMPAHNSPAMLEYIKKNEARMTREGHAAAFSFNLMSLNWMLSEKIDKPAYFVVKANEADATLKTEPALREIYRKGGFAFLKREP
jgi:hypothetical protein